MALTVELSDHFKVLFAGFPKPDKLAIAGFIGHCQAYGLVNLRGKLAPTTNVPGTDPEYYEKVAFAREHYLWHYHIGIPRYEPSRNQLRSYDTSDWVVHFQRFPKNTVIRLVDYGFHNPMHMPKAEFMIKS